MVGEGETDRDRQSARDDRVAPVEVRRRVEEVRRAPSPPAAALDLALEFGQRGAHGQPARERVAVFAVGGDDGVVGREHLHDADRAGLLADREVEKAANRRAAVELDAALLEESDAQHLVKQVDEVVILRGRALLVRSRYGLGHDGASNVEVSPSGNPSSRATG